MELTPLLQQNRDTILGKWFDLIIGTYPRVSSEFLARQQDQFRNPLGHTITQSITAIYDQVTSAMDTDELLRALDGIIRIRSVQEFTASETVQFIFQLKAVLRDVMNGPIREPQGWRDLAELESRIDQVALLAFHKYTECREKLQEIRNKELRSRTGILLERENVTSATSRRKRDPIEKDL
jgi:hypothetical protein